MRGRKIIYHCRVSCLARVTELTVDDTGFRAVAEVLHLYSLPHVSREVPGFETPFKFNGGWAMLHLCGKAVKMAMITDCFLTDQQVIAEVEAAAAAGESPESIYRILHRAWDPAPYTPSPSSPAN